MSVSRHSKFWFNLYKEFLFVVLLTFLAACTAAQDSGDNPESNNFRFDGVDRIEPQSRGKWRVIWKPITELKKPSYTVYRKDKGTNWNFENPTERGFEHFYETDDLRFSKSQCFLVRYVSENPDQVDKNVKELCTDHKPFEFTGVSNITSLNNVGFVVSWPAGEVGQNELSYEVGRRESSKQEWVAVGNTRKNFFLIETKGLSNAELAKTYCYRVKFEHPKTKDGNTTEICLDAKLDFAGLSAADYVAPDSGVLKWSLDKAQSAKIAAFNVYRLDPKGNRVLLASPKNEKEMLDFSFTIRNVSLDSEFEYLVKAVSKDKGIEDNNLKTLSFKNKNRAPTLVSFDAADAECMALDAAEKQNKDLEKTFSVAGAEELLARCKIKLTVTYRTDEIGRILPDLVKCFATFTDPDVSQNRVRPSFSVKAKLPGSERPIVVRKHVINGFVALSGAQRQGSSELSYTVDTSLDKRGTDIFCEVVVNDTLSDSLKYRSKYVPLPDTAPIATGIFISKKARYIDASSGSLHYYDDPVGQAGTTHNVLKNNLDQPIVTSEACLRSGPKGLVPNEESNDICEDTTVEILIRQKPIPESLFEPGKEAAYKAFVNALDYSQNGIADDYALFYTPTGTPNPIVIPPPSRSRVGYLDPDPDDRAMDMQVRSAFNGTVLGYSCLDGACTVTFKAKPDFSSGNTLLADQRINASKVTHGEFEYRVRTNIPETEIGLSPSGVPNADIGWSNWAIAKIELTAVDEEPKVSGMTLAAVEDTVKKIVVCEDFNDTDPECDSGKTLQANNITTGGASRFKDGKGKGYNDPERDPPIKILPRASLNPQKARWVKPSAAGGANPDPSNPSHWDLVADANTSDESLDQSLDFAPFKCFRAQGKCIGYIKPAQDQNIDKMGALQIDYNLWVEVNTATNPDPSYVGKTGADLLRKSKFSGSMVLNFLPVNDKPLVPEIVETQWKEDQVGGFEIKLLPSTTQIPSPALASASGFWDPDDDRVRDAGDLEFRFASGTGPKTSYCTWPEDITRPPPNIPGVKIGEFCRLDLGSVSYVPLANMSASGTLWLPAQDPIFATQNVSMDWFCDADIGCQGRLATPPNYYGSFNFEYRLRSTKIENGLKVLRSDDWSDWKASSVTVAPVADQPIATSFLMSSDSTAENIKEDVNFKVMIARGNGSGSVNYDPAVPGSGTAHDGSALAAKRKIFLSYFDVDDSNDVAFKINITSIAVIKGVPVIQKSDGSPITVPDSTLFTCDVFGVCSADFKPGKDVNTRSGGDPNFSYEVVTIPKSELSSGNIASWSLLPSAKTSEAKQISFTIVPSDDKPKIEGDGGGGSIPLVEDENNDLTIKFDPGVSYLGYTDPDDGDYAEKIEIEWPKISGRYGQQFNDPVPAGILAKFIVPTPPGNPFTDFGWPLPAPTPVERATDFVNRLWVLGEGRQDPNNKNTQYFTATESQIITSEGDPVNTSSETTLGGGPARFFVKGTVGNIEEPDRLQFTCRRKSQGGAGGTPGDCKLKLRGPLHFNGRDNSERTAWFRFRVFTRWVDDPGFAWNASDETNGSWTGWQKINLKLGAVNDAPVIAASFDNSSLSSKTSPALTGTNSVANPVISNEEEFTNYVFKFKNDYDSVESTTESFTYRVDANPPVGQNPLCYLGQDPFKCMTNSIEWLATKVALSGLKIYTPWYFKQEYGLYKWDVSELPSPDPDELIVAGSAGTIAKSWNATSETFEAGAPGEFLGNSATTGSPTSNINCTTDTRNNVTLPDMSVKSNPTKGQPTGDCYIKIQPPVDFFGMVESKVRFGDGSMLPGDKDWSVAATDLAMKIENIDDAPVGLPMVIDMYENRGLYGNFARMANGTTSCKETDPKFKSEYVHLASGCEDPCACGGRFVMTKDIPLLPTSLGGKEIATTVLAAEKYGACSATNTKESCSIGLSPDTKYPLSIWSYMDSDRDKPSEIQVRSENKVTVTTNGPSSVGNGGYFSLVPEANYVSVQSTQIGLANQAPYVFKGADSERGEAGFEYRLKSAAAGPFTDWKKVSTRILPVNDGLRFRNGVAGKADAPGKLACTLPNGTNTTCVKEVTVPEDKPFTIEINPADYFDPDDDQMLTRDSKYGRAVGITPCFDLLPPTNGLVKEPASIQDAFPWGTKSLSFSPGMTYQTEYENPMIVGKDPFARDASPMVRHKSSNGKLTKNGTGDLRAFSFPAGSESQDGPSIIAHSSITPSTTISTPNGDFNLKTQCPIVDGWPTGSCSMQLLPQLNSVGTYYFCAQLHDVPGPGEYFSNRIGRDKWASGGFSERFYFKINVTNEPDPPRMGQLPLRSRSNEDNDMVFEFLGQNPEIIPSAFTGVFAKKGENELQLGEQTLNWTGKLKFQNPAKVFVPGYFDFDGSKAKEMFLDLRKVGSQFTGIGTGNVKYQSNPNLPASAYDQQCVVLSGTGPNVCTIPCDSNGLCRFKLGNGPNANGRVTMRYWVRTTEPETVGLALSTLYQENSVDAGSGRGEIFAPYADSKQYGNHNIDCINRSGLKWEDWRLLEEETGSAIGIPGLYWDAIHPIVLPDNVQLNPPPTSRILANFLSLGATTSRLIVGQPSTGFPSGMSSWNYPSTFGSDVPKMFENGTGSNFGTLACETAGAESPSVYHDLRYGQLVGDFAGVPDRPLAKRAGADGIIRYFTENPQPSERAVYVGASNGDPSLNGFSDGDGDGPGRLIFLTSNAALQAVGTISLDPNPPVSPLGYGPGLLLDASSRAYVPPTDVLDAPGCIMALQRCKFYFHPKAGYSSAASGFTVDYIVATGSDLWESDTSALKVGKLALVVGEVNDLPLISFQDVIPKGIAGGASPAIKDLLFTFSEGGAGEEGAQNISFSVASSDTNVLDVQICDAATATPISCPVWTEPVGGDATSVQARLRLTPKSMVNGTAKVTISFFDSVDPAKIVKWEKNFTVVSNNTAPTVFSSDGNVFQIQEDQPNQLLVVDGTANIAGFSLDEGAGDSEHQQVEVTFSSSNPLVIPHENIRFTKEDPEGDFNMGSENGNISVSPILDAVALTTPVTVTMSVTELNTPTPLVTTFVFTVKVLPVNDAPSVSLSLGLGSPFSGQEDATLNISNIRIDEGGGIDEDSQIVSVSFSDVNSALVQSISFARNDGVGIDLGAAAASITVVPVPNAFGTNSITLNVLDDQGATASVTFIVEFVAVNDSPLLVGTIANDYTIDEDTQLTISATVVDEGGVASGIYNEDSDALTFSFTSSNAAVVPVSGISISPNTDGTSDASLVNRTITITPLVDANGSTTIQLRASDGINNNVILKSFLLTIGPKPDDLKGNITCNPSNSKNRAVNQFVFKAGSDLALLNVICSGIVDPDGDAVVYTLSGACFSQGLGIVSATGKLNGTVPAISGGSSCAATISASAGARSILTSQRRNITVYNGQLASVSLASPSLSVNDQCKVTSSAAASYGGQGSFGDAIATTTPTGFGTLVATNNSWSGVIQDFNQTNYTLNWNVTSNAGDNLSATSSLTLIKAPLMALDFPIADGTLANVSSEGVQASFLFPSGQCSSKSQCSLSPRAVVAAGEDGSCFVNGAGAVSCVGVNSLNNLGIATAGPFGVATAVSGLSDVRAVSLGKEHGCALTASKNVYCWGSNTFGQLGLGDLVPRTTPTMISDLNNVVSLSVGDHHSCALLATGAVNCWGRNNRGQLGVTPSTQIELPTEVPGVSKAKLISSGAGHNCALTNSGTVQYLKCWGDNSTDQLGLGQTVDFSSDAQEVQAISFSDYGNVRALGAGGQESVTSGIYTGHTCVSLANGDLSCWGNNSDGQLGSGSLLPTKTNGTSTAVIVKRDSSTNLGSLSYQAVALSLGASHTCGLMSDRSAWCWGNNSNGQLGVGSTTSSAFALQLTAFGTPSDVLSVTAGKEHSCFLRWGGEMACAGKQLGGRLGNNLVGAGVQTTPVQIVEPTTFVPAAGRYQKCEAISL